MRDARRPCRAPEDLDLLAKASVSRKQGVFRLLEIGEPAHDTQVLQRQACLPDTFEKRGSLADRLLGLVEKSVRFRPHGVRQKWSVGRRITPKICIGLLDSVVHQVYVAGDRSCGRPVISVQKGWHQ